MSRESIAKLIDHALLHPTMTDDAIRQGCQLAKRLGVASVCVKPYAIPLAVEELKGSDVAVGTVIGFCLLYTSPSPRDATLSRMPSSA